MNREIKFRCWDGEEMINDGDKIGHGVVNSGWILSRYPSSVMQFTGLQDKNGKDIYEGDIVKGNWIDSDHEKVDDILEVKYMDGFFTPFGSYAGDGSGMLYYTSVYVDDFEIIGNIYENPELLES